MGLGTPPKSHAPNPDVNPNGGARVANARASLARASGKGHAVQDDGCLPRTRGRALRWLARGAELGVPFKPSSILGARGAGVASPSRMRSDLAGFLQTSIRHPAVARGVLCGEGQIVVAPLRVPLLCSLSRSTGPTGRWITEYGG